MPQYSVAIHEDIDDLSGAIVDFLGGTSTIVFNTPGRPIRIYRLFLITSGSTILTFLDGATPLSAELVSADSGLIWDFDTKPWFTLGVGNDFMINSSSSTVQVSGRVYFTDGIAGTGGSTQTPANGYVTEDGLIFYVAEDGTTFYVQEI